MKIKNVIFKSNGDKLFTENYSIGQFHKLINDLNKLNPNSTVDIRISFIN